MRTEEYFCKAAQDPAIRGGFAFIFFIRAKLIFPDKGTVLE
jgi:hypothetical protein